MVTFTPEQQIAIDLITDQTHPQVVVEARAGAGKTFTILSAAKAMPNRKALVTAFNNPIIRDAETAITQMGITNAEAKTIHAAAHRANRAFANKVLQRRKNTPKIASVQMAKNLGITDLDIDNTHHYPAGFLASLTIKAVEKFCASGDQEIGPKHLGRIEALDAEGSWVNHNILATHLNGALLKAKEDMFDPKGWLTRPDHYVYLKRFELEGPLVDYKVVFVDEGQDLSGVMLSIVMKLVAQGIQVVVVGDPFQQINQWMGAIDALDKIPNAKRCFLTESFRFGPPIADVANKILVRIDENVKPMTGIGGPSTVGVIDHSFCTLTRTNGGALQAVLEELERDGKPHLVGDGTQIKSFVYGARDLQMGKRTENPELAMFSSWSDVQDYVQNDPQGEDIAMLVRLIDNNGVSRILAALGGCVTEANATKVVSTAHKSKGRQWKTVEIGPDFAKKQDDKAQSESEKKELNAQDLQLLYVACTRAKSNLDWSRCGPLTEILGECPEV